MKRIMTAGALFLTFGISQGMAQNCTGVPLTVAKIEALVNGRYACVGSFPTATWNELHTGTGASPSGSMKDYKLGPTSTTDPSAIVGTYLITGTSANPQTTGTITYTYGSYVYGYNIYSASTGVNPGPYSFCTTTGGQNLLVTISVAHC